MIFHEIWWQIYLVVGGSGEVRMPQPPHFTRADAIAWARENLSDQEWMSWKQLYRRGYRAHRIEVSYRRLP